MDETHEDLLRKIGRELQENTAQTKRAANSVGWLLALTLLNVLVASLWAFGLVEVSVTTG